MATNLSAHPPAEDRLITIAGHAKVLKDAVQQARQAFAAADATSAWSSFEAHLLKCFDENHVFCVQQKGAYRLRPVTNKIFQLVGAVEEAKHDPSALQQAVAGANLPETYSVIEPALAAYKAWDRHQLAKKVGVNQRSRERAKNATSQPTQSDATWQVYLPELDPRPDSVAPFPSGQAPFASDGATFASPAPTRPRQKRGPRPRVQVLPQPAAATTPPHQVHRQVSLSSPLAHQQVFATLQHTLPDAYSPVFPSQVASASAFGPQQPQQFFAPNQQVFQHTPQRHAGFAHPHSYHSPQQQYEARPPRAHLGEPAFQPPDPTLPTYFPSGYPTFEDSEQPPYDQQHFMSLGTRAGHSISVRHFRTNPFIPIPRAM
ncbi:hypothetical protein JCM10908_002669 [Rhodotorula pacifica]|uniref:uncharacterized protein n=1 Tax=Rhodotorula pacifica TaxID=1495444 RepID=UPI00317D9564